MSAKLQSAKSEITEDIIQVEDIHIKLGIKYSMCNCPIANAIRYKFPSAEVYENYVDLYGITYGSIDSMYKLDDTLKAIIKTYDNTGLMDKITIIINHKIKEVCLKT